MRVARRTDDSAVVSANVMMKSAGGIGSPLGVTRRTVRLGKVLVTINTHVYANTVLDHVQTNERNTESRTFEVI